MKEIGAGSGLTLKWEASTGKMWTGVSGDKFTAELKKILGDSWQTEIKVKRTTEFNCADGASLVEGCWAIEVSKNGTVTRKAAPSSKSVS